MIFEVERRVNLLKNIKNRLNNVGKTQRWLVEELRKRGFTGVDASKLSTIINGRYTYGCAHPVLEESDRILSELESKNERRAV